jgi:hypothetical protein
MSKLFFIIERIFFILSQLALSQRHSDIAILLDKKVIAIYHHRKPICRILG